MQWRAGLIKAKEIEQDADLGARYDDDEIMIGINT